MKYTRYLLSRQFIDIDQLDTNKLYLRVITLPIGASISVMGFVLIAGLLPPAFIMDKSKEVMVYFTKKVKE